MRSGENALATNKGVREKLGSAFVMLGGMTTVPVLNLLVLQVIYSFVLESKEGR